ncbi:MAG: hypothetical protein JRJ79_10600 [Deltaproteobacteria bacterium]|nr:hypothetical protein [Deltaproteobacteria bacterium]MBW1795615.1 hypothetical protein [Deltaproteobacteria bacterium]
MESWNGGRVGEGLKNERQKIIKIKFASEKSFPIIPLFQYSSFCVGGSRLLRYCSKIVVVVLLSLAWPVLAISSEALAGGLKIGEEVMVASEGPGGKLRSLPAVAYGDGIYLVVWQEGWHGDQGNSRIYAARLGLDRKVLDPGGVEIAPCKTGVQENPRVAFIDGVFLVVWQDLRNGEDCDVLGARVSLEGKVLDPAPMPIGIGPRTQAMPDVAADDEGFLVVWHGFQGRETAAKIFAACIGRAGPAGKAVVIASGATPPDRLERQGTPPGLFHRSPLRRRGGAA